MGRSISLYAMYGVDLYNAYDGFWRINEAQDDWGYVLPWNRGLEEADDDDIDQARLCRFLLKRFKGGPSDQFLDGMDSAWDLNELLKELTGLSLKHYGWEYGNLFLASGPKVTEYSMGPMLVNEQTLEVTDEQKRQLAWAIEQFGCTFTDKPGVKVMASYG